MSVIVKNLSLPESCSQCRFLAYDDYSTGHEFECLPLREFMDVDDLPEGRRSDCPLFDENTETLQSIVMSDRYGNVAEYVKAIRCKDCKHRITANCERFGIKRYTQSDSFCSWAERKESEQ